MALQFSFELGSGADGLASVICTVGTQSVDKRPLKEQFTQNENYFIYSPLLTLFLHGSCQFKLNF